MNKGAFIAFEGTEGCGKSTQLRLAAKALQQEGRAVRVTMEPGGTPLGVQLREMLLAPTAPIPTPLTELFLYLADRAQHVEEMIRPALGKGEIVLTDRYSASTVAYQGYGRGLDLTSVEQADRWARGQLSPTLTLLLDCPVRTGLARARGHDRFHAEEEAFHERVRNGFLQLARGGGAAWKTIDATAPVERVHAEVLAAIQNHLEPRSRRAESG